MAAAKKAAVKKPATKKKAAEKVDTPAAPREPEVWRFDQGYPKP